MESWARLGILIPWIAFLGLLAAYFVLKYLRSERVRLLKAQRVRRRSLQAAPVDEIARVVGRVRLKDRTILAPITRTPCAFYRVVAEDSGRTDERPAILFSEERAQDFWIEESPQVRALVRMSKAVVIARAAVSFETAGVANAPFESFLRSHNDATRALVGTSVVARESTLAEGALIAVVGVVRRPSQTGSAYRDEAAEVELVAGRSPLLVTDDSKLTETASSEGAAKCRMPKDGAT